MAGPDESCVICMTAPIERGFLHGHSLHFCVCSKCSLKISVNDPCPLCRVNVERIINVFSTKESAKANTTATTAVAAPEAAAPAAAASPPLQPHALPPALRALLQPSPQSSAATDSSSFLQPALSSPTPTDSSPFSQPALFQTTPTDSSRFPQLALSSTTPTASLPSPQPSPSSPTPLSQSPGRKAADEQHGQQLQFEGLLFQGLPQQQQEEEEQGEEEEEEEEEEEVHQHEEGEEALQQQLQGEQEVHQQEGEGGTQPRQEEEEEEEREGEVQHQREDGQQQQQQLEDGDRQTQLDMQRQHQQQQSWRQWWQQQRRQQQRQQDSQRTQPVGPQHQANSSCHTHVQRPHPLQSYIPFVPMPLFIVTAILFFLSLSCCALLRYLPAERMPLGLRQQVRQVVLTLDAVRFRINVCWFLYSLVRHAGRLMLRSAVAGRVLNLWHRLRPCFLGRRQQQHTTQDRQQQHQKQQLCKPQQRRKQQSAPCSSTPLSAPARQRGHGQPGSTTRLKADEPRAKPRPGSSTRIARRHTIVRVLPWVLVYSIIFIVCVVAALRLAAREPTRNPQAFGSWEDDSRCMAGVECSPSSYEGYDNGSDAQYIEPGYAEDGFEGDFEDGYNVNGYDAEGFDNNGFGRDGYDSEGYDKEGYDAEGYNAQGYNARGYDRNGYNAEGRHAAIVAQNMATKISKLLETPSPQLEVMLEELCTHEGSCWTRKYLKGVMEDLLRRSGPIPRELPPADLGCASCSCTG